MKEFDDTKKLRVCHIPQNDLRFCIPVKTAEDGQKMIDLLTGYDLYIKKHGLMTTPDFDSFAFLELYDDGEWIEYCSEGVNLFELYTDNKEINQFRQDILSQS